ncbi:zinc finger protein Aiolos-like isoform X3 [Phycodurus eques]|uniref:zinc finger protein Aiolos-like isoform X3 n=1 Tax=Phycodurus eques TaxID=693459 RepID=UPI002ACD8662|nr:zinc finger protein Aiolos-like isoform X3 [Phycodurus eques]
MNTDKNPGFVSTTGNGIGMIKVEDEETGNETYAEAEKERAILPKEEREGITEEGMEEGMEEGYDGDRTEDDDDNDGERDSVVEPEDLSMVDYSLYNSAALQDASTGAASERTHMTGAMTPHVQPMGKLNCDICGLSCVSINVLLVHKRSHTVEKPFKCNLCSRSYKQRSSLEEHRERCHVYIHSKAPAEKADDSHLSRTQMGTERALLLDRLATNVAKRKSSMPQKFTGDNGVCLDLSLNRNPVQQQDPPLGSPGPDVHSQQPLMRSGPDSDPAHSQRPYPVLLNRNDISPIGLTNGHKMIMPLPGLPHTPQQPLGVDAFYTDSSHGSPIMYSLGHLLGGLNHQNGIPHSQPIPLSPLEALQVARADREAGGMPGALYSCSHCKVIFLDYVMFTIHMGCHGFRDPLECNVCGHRSRDRYEFSSHIVRGEHRVEMK